MTMTQMSVEFSCGIYCTILPRYTYTINRNKAQLQTNRILYRTRTHNRIMARASRSMRLKAIVLENILTSPFNTSQIKVCRWPIKTER